MKLVILMIFMTAASAQAAVLDECVGGSCPLAPDSQGLLQTRVTHDEVSLEADQNDEDVVQTNDGSTGNEVDDITGELIEKKDSEDEAEEEDEEMSEENVPKKKKKVQKAAVKKPKKIRKAPPCGSFKKENCPSPRCHFTGDKCEVDINSDKHRENGLLTFATLMALQNVTRLANNIDFPKRHGHPDYTRDMQTLADNVAGLYKLMGDVLASDAKKKQFCPAGDLTSIRMCVHKALCVFESNIDWEKKHAKEDLKTYTMLMEYYSRFDDITWHSLISDLNKENTGSGKGSMKIGFMDPSELGCANHTPSNASVNPIDGTKDFMDDLEDKMVHRLVQTGAKDTASDSSVKAAAYRTSTALLDAARTTHVLLDSHTHNSSVDVTIAALHRAWEPPCKLLNCDHTNYWDLLGASHSHSLALIESGASAQHMQVHVRSRARLEHRMQHFLGEHGEKFASKIYRLDGTKTEAQGTRYGSVLKDSLRHVLTNHPKTYGLDSTLLSLMDRQEMKQFFKTPRELRLLEALWNNNLPIDSDEQALQAFSDDEELDEEDEKRSESLIQWDWLNRAAKAIGSAISAFVAWLVSLLSCMGWDAVAKIGYIVKFPKIGIFGVAFSFMLTAVADLEALVKGSIGDSSIGVSMSVVAGVIPGGSLGLPGLRLGLGVSANVLCGGSQASCWLTLGVGAVASALVSLLLPCVFGCAKCPFGARAFGMDCAQVYGIVFKILCCKIDLISGAETCSGEDLSSGKAPMAACLQWPGWTRPYGNVATSNAGAESCKSQCKSGGYTYFGFECPMGAQVHCQCSNSIGGTSKTNAYCEGTGSPLVHPHNHCTGPYVKDGYRFGDYGVGSAYRTEASTLIPGSKVALKGGKDGKYCADEGNTVKCNRGGIGGWEKFTVVDAGSGKIALKGGKDGKYCADEGNTVKCNRGGIGGWETFTVVIAGSGKIALKGGKDGKYCADEGNTVKCNRGGIGGWEKFTVECLQGCR